MFFYHSIHDLIRNLSFYQPIVVHNNIMPEFLYLLVSTIALQYIIYPYPKHHLDQKKQYNPTLILQIFSSNQNNLFEHLNALLYTNSTYCFLNSTQEFLLFYRSNHHPLQEYRLEYFSVVKCYLVAPVNTFLHYMLPLLLIL